MRWPMSCPYDLFMTTNPNTQFAIKAAWTTLANFMLVVFGALVVPSTVLFVAWAVSVLVFHSVFLVWVAVNDLHREFGGAR